MWLYNSWNAFGKMFNMYWKMYQHIQFHILYGMISEAHDTSFDNFILFLFSSLSIKKPRFFQFFFNTYNTTPFVCKHEGSLIHHIFLIHHKLPNHCSFSTGINFVYAYIILQTVITSESDKKNPVKEKRWMIHIIVLARLTLSLMSLSRWIYALLLRQPIGNLWGFLLPFENIMFIYRSFKVWAWPILDKFI